MDTEETSNENTTDAGPLGYWLRVVDALLAHEYAAGFAGAEVSRRDGTLLSVLAGDAAAPGLAERLARKGKRLRGLADRGWVAEQPGGIWTLTDEGREARDRLGGVVDGIRSRVADAVSPDDLATTLASLEAIARELGWDETMETPRRGFGPGFGFGHPGFGGPVPDPGRAGFGRSRHRGFASPWGPGHGPDGHGAHDEDGHGSHGHDDGADEHESHGPHMHQEHGHGSAHGSHRHGPHGRGCGGQRHGGDRDGHGRRRAERAYERGFEAGFARGRDARG